MGFDFGNNLDGLLTRRQPVTVIVDSYRQYFELNQRTTKLVFDRETTFLKLRWKTATRGSLHKRRSTLNRKKEQRSPTSLFTFSWRPFVFICLKRKRPSSSFHLAGCQHDHPCDFGCQRTSDQWSQTEADPVEYGRHDPVNDHHNFEHCHHEFQRSISRPVDRQQNRRRRSLKQRTQSNHHDLGSARWWTRLIAGEWRRTNSVNSELWCTSFLRQLVSNLSRSSRIGRASM